MDDHQAAAGLFGLLFGAVGLCFAVAVYVYISYCLMVIAKKTGRTTDLRMAWVPIAQIVLMCQIAKKPVWWVLLFLVPCVNIVIAVIIWMGIAEARGKP